MLLFLSLTGIVLSIILLYFNARKYASSIYLGSFFLLVSLYGLIQYTLFYSNSVFLVSIVYINFTFFTYLIGPALYWYIRSVLNDDSKLKKRDLWHLLPALIFLVMAIPHLFTPWSEKMTGAAEIVKNIGYLATNKPTMLYELLPSVAIHISRPLLVLLYTIWSAVIFFQYITSTKERAIFPGQRYMIRWISLLLGSLLILALSQMLMLGEAYADRDSKLFFTSNVLQIISVVGIISLLLSPFFFPGILYGLPRFPELITLEKKSGTEVYLSYEVEKKRIPALESDYIEQIRNKLDHCMTMQQPYLHRDCNLVYVSKCLNLPVHHLAFYFREVKKQSFNDYRNELRISHAKLLIREGKARELTLEGIALQSGFSTRNTFFTAFKRIEGETPSTYSSKFSG